MDHQDDSHLRARIQDLLPKAKILVGGAVPERADLDRMLEELSGLEEQAGASFADDDASLGTLRAALGALYAFRGNRFGWTDEDRAEALRCFRTARAGGHMTAEANLDAMLLFAVMLVPSDVSNFGPDSTGKLGPMLALIQQMQESGPMLEDLRELHGLIGEIVAAHPDDPRSARLKVFGTSLDFWFRLLRDPSTVTTADMRGLLADPPFPMTGQVGVILEELMKQAEILERRGALEPPSPSPTVEPASAAEKNIAWDDLAIYVEMSVPGALSPAELRARISRYEAEGTSRSLGIAAFGRLALAVRTNDPLEVDQALQNLRKVMSSPDAGEMSWLATSVLPGLLSWAASSHGNREDEAKALGMMLPPEGLPMPGLTATGDPELDEINVVSAHLGYSLFFSKIAEAGDDAALEALIAELDRTAPVSDAAAEWRFLRPVQQALAELAFAVHRQDADMARRAQAHIQAALEMPMPPAVSPLVAAVASSTQLVAAALENRPAEIGEVVADARGLPTTNLVAHDGAVQTRMLLASGLMMQYLLLGDGPDKERVLGAAIDELEQAKNLLTDRTGTQIASRILWSLAEALRYRRDAALRDNRRAVKLTRESLGLLAGDVLLQLGAEHGLQAARNGALRGLKAAGWALEEHRVEDAVEVLELGRGLVLRAAATAGTVPDRLRAVGEVGLAEQWEQANAGSGDDDDGRAVPSGDADEFNLPSDLRRRALDALRVPRAASAAADSPMTTSPAAASATTASAAVAPTVAASAVGGANSDLLQQQRDLLVVPTVPQIVEHLDRAGLDALVYLLPGIDGVAGKVLMILRNGATRELPLASEGKVDAYLETSARRYQQLRGGDANRDLSPMPRWELSLDELCAWAGTSVMDRVIAALPFVPTPDAPGRVVLIPCGQLGLVPWHAAAISRKPATAGLSRAPRACDVLVMSYAASADELLRSLSRRRTPYAADPVLVVDPSQSLHYAEAEAVAVRQHYLPGARLMGSVEGQEVEAAGTPRQVQAALTGDEDRAPASMVQVIAHGTASSTPTASRLQLARPDGTGPEYLTVAEIMDASRPGTRDRFSSLVILDCCETDLSSRDHDEALTLTTAFVARGATDVIGSRWAIDDWATAVCMIVFHHHLAAGDVTPAEALRAAQRWMLDPEREAIPAVSESLLREMRTPLDGVANWAPFIHQGNAGLS